jgi:polysaccharide biosynthesis transport protein
MSFNLEQIYRLTSQLDEVNAKIRNLEDIKAGSPGLQTPASVTAGTASSGDPAAADSWARLAQLRAQLLSLQSRYSDKHPDVKKTKGEIQKLETQLGVSENEKERELNNLRNRLASLKKSTGADDPEVKRLSEEISILSRQVEDQKRNLRRASSTSVDNELNRQLTKREEIQRKISEYTRKSQASTIVQKEYSNLVQEYENASKQYNDTSSKLSDAKTAKEIEDTKLGERFTVIEEPQVPFKPEKPNRMKILLGGFFLALCGGLFASIVMENLDHTIKSAEQLRKITKVPVLTVLPFVMTDEERKAHATNVFKKIFGDVRQVASNLVRKGKAEDTGK